MKVSNFKNLQGEQGVLFTTLDRGVFKKLPGVHT